MFAVVFASCLALASAQWPAGGYAQLPSAPLPVPTTFPTIEQPAPSQPQLPAQAPPQPQQYATQTIEQPATVPPQVPAQEQPQQYAAQTIEQPATIPPQVPAQEQPQQYSAQTIEQPATLPPQVIAQAPPQQYAGQFGAPAQDVPAPVPQEIQTTAAPQQIPQTVQPISQPLSTGSETETTKVVEEAPDCKQAGDGYYVRGCSTNYWRCVNDMLFKHDCPAGLHFNPSNRQCTYKADIALCRVGADAVPSENQSMLTKASALFNCADKADGKYKPQDVFCSSTFVTCLSGKLGAENACPMNLFFNEKTGECDQRTNVAACIEY